MRLTCLTAAFIAAALTSFAQAPSYVPTDGLMAWYPFDGNADDASGNAHHGMVSGAVLTTDRNGAADAAYSFAGNCSDRIDMDLPDMANNSAFSISFWAKRDGSGCLNPRLWEFWNGEITTQCSWFNSWDYITFSGVPINTTLNDGEWIHFVLTEDGEDWRTYVNGQLTNTYAQAFVTNSPDFAIGRMNHSAWDSFNGDLDDFGVWNRTLTDAEVASLFSATPSPSLPDYVPSDDLVAFYPLDGDALDAGPHGLDGTLNGASSVADRNGVAGGALAFDGQDDFIRVQHSAEFDAMASEFTISAWIQNEIWTQPNWLYYVSKSDQLGGWGFNGGFLLRAGADGGGGFGYVPKMETTGGEWQLSSPDPLIDTWEHVAFTFTGDSAHLYRDGQRVASRESLGGDMVLNAFDVIIGAGYEAQDHHVLADMDDIGFWSRALEDEEIETLAGIEPDPCQQVIMLDEVTVLSTPTDLQSANGEIGVSLTQGTAASFALEGLNGSPDYTFVMPTLLNGIAPGYYNVIATDPNGCVSPALPAFIPYELCCACGVHDADSDGICDDEDACTDKTNPNYNDPANLPCE